MSIKLAWKDGLDPVAGCSCCHNSSPRSALNSAAGLYKPVSGFGVRGSGHGPNYTMGTAIDDSLRPKICSPS